MIMSEPHILRENPSKYDEEWRFFNIPAHLIAPRPTRSGKPRAKLVRFTPEKITLQASELASNRVVHHDDPEKIVVASFEGLRFPDERPSVSSEYIFRLLKAGLFLNGRQYRFFGHGNSQLVSTRTFNLIIPTATYCDGYESAAEDAIFGKRIPMRNWINASMPWAKN